MLLLIVKSSLQCATEIINLIDSSRLAGAGRQLVNSLSGLRLHAVSISELTTELLLNCCNSRDGAH